MKGGAASPQEEVCKEGLDSKLKVAARQSSFVIVISVAQKKCSKNRVFVANVSMVRTLLCLCGLVFTVPQPPKAS